METVIEFLNKLANRGVKLSAEAGQLSCYAPPGALTPDLRQGIVKFKAEIIALLERKGAETLVKPSAPRIHAIDRTQDQLPLSIAQERLWFIHQLEPANAGQHLPLAVTLTGDLSSDRLEQAFQSIIARHETLRTVFPIADGQARQQILDRVDFRIDCLDLRADSDRDARAREICRTEAAIPFDLACGPLFRAKLIRLAEQEHVLVLTMHSIVSDGWSQDVLLGELDRALEAVQHGLRPEPATLPVQYADYSVWQRTWLDESGTLERQLAYWREKLAGAPESLDLGTDYPRPAVQSFAGTSHAFTVDAQLTAQLRTVAQSGGGTLYMVLLAAFKALLHRYTGQNDICVGSPVSNRNAETETLIGLFANALALRSQVEGEETFNALLSRVKATCLEAYANQETPFEKVVDVLRPQRNLAMSPIFQVMVAMQSADTAAPRFPRYAFDSGISRFDITAAFTETPQGLSGSIEYSTALYKAETIERMAAHFVALCRAIVATPAAKIGELDYLGDAEKRHLLVDFNNTGVVAANDKCLHDLFVEQAALHPERIAVVCGGERLTYRQLAARSRELALYLQAAGVGPDDLVGLCVERSIEMIVGLLGIMQAGGAYVPLDTEFPADRIAYMVQDSRAKIVLTQASLQEKLGAVMPTETRLVALDTQWNEIAARANDVSFQSQVRPQNLAYVMYTSGSTGRPKGVMVEHRQIVAYVTAIQQRLQFVDGSSFALASTFAADLGNTVLFPSLVGGGTLHVLSREAMTDAGAYAAYCLEHRIDCMKVTPSHLQALIGDATDASLIPARTLVMGGEVLSRGLVDLVKTINPQCRVFNHYGPTECSVGVLSGEIRADIQTSRRTIPLGSPLSGTRIYILDRKGQPVPVGVPGELFIGGVQVARGYWNQPELTAERFVADPFYAGRMYKTGDVAKWREDGTVEYLGRNDFQVKIRGFRIELGEIEAQLAKYAGVKEALVLAREDEPGDKRLVAYVTATGEALSVEELRGHMQANVPQYMVPSAFVVLDAMPLTPNGKVDRRALPRPEADAYVTKAYEAPQGEIEETLATIWQELLHVERVGRNDNFFELGGHSLLATRLISKVRNVLNADVPLKALFEHTTVARFAELVANAAKSDIPAIRSVDRASVERLPLSYAQERLWFFDQLVPGSAGYNLPKAVTIKGGLNVDQLEQAFRRIIARHEILRTVFPSDEGQARQVILDAADFSLERVDLSDCDARDAKIQEICAADAAAPFDLARGPLLRGKVIRVAADEHVLLLNLHHIVSDGWSTGILIQELGAIMDAFRQGREPELAPLPIQYADYSVWQRTWLEESGVLQQQLAYWREKLGGAPESLDLATDYARPGVQSFAGAAHAFTLDAQLTGQLKGLARQNGGTLYMVLLAAFNALLHRYTGQNDICVGSPIANRQYGETESLIGMFINTLALRTQIEGSETFAGLLSQVKATCLEAYEHQDAPFEKVVELLRPQRNLAVSPIFQVMLILQNAADVRLQHEQFALYPLQSGISKFDLTVTFTETPEALGATIEYSTALYKAETIERMTAHFVAFCRAIAATPTARISEVDYLGDAERHRLLVGFNDSQLDLPRGQCLHDLFVEQASLHPERTAVVCSDGQLTYQELYDRSRALALYLQSEGVSPDALVGLCVERSLDMITGLLGIMQAGGAYVPLDFDFPDDRIAYMVQDSRATVVLTQAKFEERLRALLPAGTKLVALDRQWTEIRDRANEVSFRRDVQPQHLAYVMYTSGSTGRPKGVMVEHRQILAYVTAIQKKLQFPEGASFALVSTFAADLGNTVLFPSLAVGGTLHVLSREAMTDTAAYAAYCVEHRIDCMKLTPSHLQALVGDGNDDSLIPSSTLVLGGEVLSRSVIDLIRRINPACRVFNHYGPTECSVGVLSGEVKADVQTSRRTIPLGSPLSGTRIYILDPRQQPVPVGIPGELYIGGMQVARGYWNQPELTGERFVADPFHGGRMYKTGDVAKWREDGTVEYLGRNDFQVKIRGFRIELGEIEAQLAKYAGVKEALVLAREDEPGDKRLVAYVTATGETLSVEELRAHMQANVPQYMVPSAFVVLDAMPLTPNGKVDRKALPRPEADAFVTKTYEPPQGDVEETLAAIWQELLRVERVGRNDNFFELGGHSLLATRLISRIRSRFSVDLPLKALFEHTTVARFAELIANAAGSNVPPIRPVGRTQSEQLPLSFAQERLWFFDQLEPGSAVYNMPRAVTLRGELDARRLEQAFEQIIARHEILRTIFPSQDGKARQVILDRVEFRLEQIDVTAQEDRQARAQEICQIEAATPFDLTRGPLFRGKLIKVDEREHVLMLNMHHIISDGWSLGVLIKELGAILEGAEPAALPIQYADYSAWQRAWLENGGILQQQLAYWQQKLAGIPESLDLVTDYPRPNVQSFAGATHMFTIDPQLSAQLRTLAQQTGATMYMVLLAAFNALLHRYTGQDDICVGSPIANRQYGETEGLIGMFANTVALRSRVEAKDSFAALLEQVKATCLEAYENQDAPFEKIVDVLHLQRNLAVSPVFQVMFILQNADIGRLDPRFPRLLLDSVVSKFDITAAFTETPDGLAGLVEYSTALYKRETIERMAEHFTALCRAIVATPAARISDLDYLGAAEEHRLLIDYNATQADYPQNECLHELFVKQAAQRADEIAVICGDESVTYQQLYDRSRELALYLQSQGVQPDSLVGLCMDRSIDLIVGMLGILQAGGAYVPLDPNYPDDRLAYMVQHSRASIVVTQESLVEQLRALVPAETQLIALDTQWDTVAATRNNVLEQKVGPDDLAYVIYTSGSTGQPKGVAIEHHSPVTLVHWASDVFTREELAGVLTSTSICFDLSVYEIFVTLSNGGTIILVPNALGLIDLPNKSAVTLINTVPSAMEELVRSNAIPDSVQTINLAGEPLSATLVDKIYSTTAVRKVYDLYGPSEDTTYSTYVLRQPNAPATIGRPIANTQVYILDASLNPQPIGVPGELYIAGDGLARGYLHRPELTQERFVANPFQPGTRMYKTGDLARWLDDGNIQYLGRIDTQVKIRGFRIELGEIENRLAQHPAIQDAAVIAQGQDGNRQLVAFYRAAETTADGIVEVSYDELRAHLSVKLPEYMVPAAFVSLQAIPLSPNGKIDRRALSRIDVTISSARDYVAPRNETEKQLVEIWSEVLKLAPESVGLNDNFFELGGHSLLATQLIAKVRSHFSVDVPLKALFEHTTLGRFAEMIMKKQTNETAHAADDNRHSAVATQLLAKLRNQLGDDSPLKALLEVANVEQLAALLAEAETTTAVSEETSVVPVIRPVDRTQFERLPLSFAQERLWFVSELEAGNAVYNIPVAVTIRGELDVEQLELAFNLIIERHEILRTAFPSQEGQAQQVILDRVDFKLDRIDIRNAENKEARAKEICKTEGAKPFDLARGPLFRGAVIRLDEQEHLLMLSMHHIVSDGWSLGILIKELGAIMEAFREGRTPELAPLPIQYADYSAWQRTRLTEGGVIEEQLAYWQEKLTGVPESLDLLTDRPRPGVQSFAGATHTFTLDEKVSAQLRGLAQKQGGTLFMVLLAAFKALLHRYTGQNDICVGTPIANRQYGETQGLIGMFVNTLPLRSQFDGKDSFSTLLSQVKTTCLEAYDRQETPFEKIVDALHLQRNLAVSPVFQVMFILQNADMGTLDQRFRHYPLHSGISKFDLTASFTETPQGLTGTLEYCTALYEPQTIERMAEHFAALCGAIATAPNAAIRDLEYLDAAEKTRLLVDYNATQAEYTKNECLHDLFVAQAAQSANEVAAICGDEHLTYQQLHDRSRELALYLQSQGVEPDRLVGVCIERSLDMVVGMLGILQAGGAYVPLDPDYPADRLAYMVKDSNAAVVLTQESLVEKLRALVPAETQVIALDTQWDTVASTRDRVLEQKVGPHHLSHVIYTSGSTGQPKGVAIEHHSPVTLVHWASEVFTREELAGVLTSTSICFDLSVYEIFVTLSNGGTIILVPNALGLIDLLNRSAVTLINTVPSAMEELVRSNAIPDSVQTINLAGEPLTATLVDKIYGTTSVRKVYDLYGPSEDTTYSTFVLRQPNMPATIGRPIANTQVYILDANQQLQPIGVPGELHIAGDGLAREYLNRPELTQDKFVANPFEPGTRMYKTGDLARWLGDGNIQYLGRIDTQVKIRGFRIELGEIENRLSQHPGIQDTAVIAQTQDGNKQLVAFYRATETTAENIVEIPYEDLRAHLIQKLPEYMVPAAFVSLAAIPLSPNGKVDRRALSRIEVAFAAATDYVAPRNAVEKQLVEIWAEVLKLEPETIGVHDSFFELGGHSLLATRLVSKIRTGLNLELPLKTLFERTTVAELAELVPTPEPEKPAAEEDSVMARVKALLASATAEELAKMIAEAEAAKSGEKTEKPAEDESTVPVIRPIDRTQYDRLPLSFAQERLWFVSELETGSAIYNIPVAVKIRGELNVDQLERALAMLVERHEVLRTVFPSQEGQAQQVILDDAGFCLQRIDISAAPDRVAEICKAEGEKPFDLASGPLFRAAVIRLQEQEHVLMLTMHHIISDGWSLGILIQELGAIMEAFREGRTPAFAPLPIQYVDYSAWQRTWLEEGGALEQQLAYWQQKLAGVPESLDLLTDRPRPNVQSFAGATHAFTVDAQLSNRLRNLAQQQGGTLFMSLLAAFNALLYRYTGQNDICVGTPIANRQHAETEGLIGMFVNTLALRSQIDGEQAFSTLLAQVRETCFEAYEHQETPFEKIVDMLSPERNLAVSPIFQVMLILQNADLGRDDQRFVNFPLDSDISKFDLTASFTETADGLAASFTYSTALYEPQTIARMAEHFVALCRAVTDMPAARVRDLGFLGEAEKTRLLMDYNATQADYANDACLHDLFVAQAAQSANEVAAICGDEHLTYQQLHDRSRELALYLQSQGVGPDRLVGVCIERSLDMVVGMLGILQAGGAYVPLDPDYPADRLAYMVKDSNAAIVLTQESLVEKLRALVPAETQIIALDTQWDTVASTRDRVLEQKVRPHHLSHVIYTSGSTGQPKGVAIEHHSPVTLVHWASEVFTREELAGVLTSTSICFDLSVYEIFVTLSNGGTIILVPNALGLIDLPNKDRVTLINTVPSAMEELVRSNAIPDSVQTINLAGEPLTATLVDKIYGTTSVRKVYDLYGPSEDTTYSTFVLRQPNMQATIGRPIANTQVYILDANQQLQPIGVPGELHIAGDGLAREYLNRPELTQDKFVANPFEPGTRMYKTGDLARWLGDGNIQYLGRIDTQVKIRGFRIELGEIENRLSQHPGIQDTAVIAQTQDGSKQLVAFYRATDTTAENIVEIPYEDLRAHLIQKLPEYMVPAAFVSLQAIPLSPNGKVDRRALSRIEVAFAAATDYVAPRNAVEKQLVEIWAEVLKLEPGTIGVHDSFFELGGHSLLATRLVSKIRTALNVNLPLKALFERTSVAELAELIPDAAAVDIPPIRPVDRTKIERLPLSFAQERMWFFDQLEPGSVRYNITSAIAIDGELDVVNLEQAFNLIIARHENLRTVFPSHDGQAQQRILDHLDFRLERIDITQEEDKDARAKEICRADAATPFDLARGPLFRGKVIKLGDREHILVLSMHHIVSDGWSTAILMKELATIMEAFREDRAPVLTPLPVQYADYSVWQRTWLEEGGVLERQLAYWQKKLTGVPESLDLVTDYPRPSVQSVAGARFPFSLDAELTADLKRLAEQRGGTLYMVLLAAFQTLLYRYTGQNDICVGSLIANRQYAEIENLIGMFFNTLALRSQVEGEDTFSALLSQVKATCLEAYEHQDTPFEKVVDVMRPQRNLAISPIFQVMLILHNVEAGTLDDHMRPYPLGSDVSQFDLSAAFIEKPDEGLTAYLVYSTALFKPQTIERMAGHFTALCRAIVAAPTAKILDLEYLGETERHQLLVQYNDTRADYPKDKRIHDFFAEQVLAQPDRTAVVDGDRTLTYRELYDRCQDLALYLQSEGVNPDDIVALCLERSAEMMIGIMGTEQAGAAYLPADPAYPDDRLAYMLQDSQSTVVLTQERFKDKVTSLLEQDAQIIALDTEWARIADRAAALRAQGVTLRDDVTPNNVSYLIYTSGSTGRPKGVLVEHQALVNRIHWMQKCYQLTPADVVLQKTPYSFDVSVWEFFWPMMTGSSVVFARPEGHKDVRYLETLINDTGVTTLHFVPSMLHAFLDNAKDSCPGVRQIFCSGEALDRKSADHYRARFPNSEMHNLYGPTEAAIDVTSYDCSQAGYPFVPIGIPIDNIQIYILDPHDHPQPIGVPGELHIAGDGLARGYLDRPELTSSKFVSNPFTPGARMYKTGDLARWLDDGNIQYLGRIDTQVKIRGFRIETGEIEAQLNTHPSIKDSAVIPQGQGGEKQLIAFYQAAETQGDRIVQIPYEEIRAHLLRTLPEYMVPAAFVSIAAIPVNSNGKADRKVLSRMEVKIASAEEYVAPRTERERQLVEIWAHVLKREPETIGVNDNFFELGGHSLLAVKLIERMRQQGLHTTLQVLFNAPTLAKLAAAAESETPDSMVEAGPDFEAEAVLDPSIVLRTEGAPGEMRNVFLTGATGFLGAFLLSDLLTETRARVYCLVRAANVEAGYRKIEDRMRQFGLWNPALRDRIVPLPGDLASPMLGLSNEKFEELARTVDAIYHNGASVNFYYPYSVLKAPNVVSTEELLRMTSVGRSKSFHFVSTLHVTTVRTGTPAVITENDPLPGPQNLLDGYAQSKWVAEKLVAQAVARGIQAVTYRPSQIIGHSGTGAGSISDFVPSFLRGCMQAGCVPEFVGDRQLYLAPVDYVSRSIVAISKRQDVSGRVFNLTNSHPTALRELLDGLLKFDPSLQTVSYEEWKAEVGADPENALARYLASFADHLPTDVKPIVRPRYDCEQTLKLAEEAGIVRPRIDQPLFQTYFSFLSEHTTSRAGVAAQ